ncbi:IS3 family transposase [Aliarcobacter cryaerophilus]|uniref:IS3 family transposase n=1 Tax=Aliarcobacter cryaerophilus TaxID=28198 RepID=UPI0013FD8A36
MSILSIILLEFIVKISSFTSLYFDKKYNICIERFWRSAKVEKIYLNEYDRVSVLKDDVKDYINFYNHKRFHESLEYKKPMEVYSNSMKINEKNYTSISESVA